MIKIVVFCLFLVSVFSDCPLVSDPRRSLVGTAYHNKGNIVAQFNNDPNLHGTPIEYAYALSQDLSDGAVNIAIAIIGFEVNPHSVLDFIIENIPTTVTSLKFRVRVTDSSLGWKSIHFNFFATQSFLFQAVSQTVTQFSTASSGKYSLYRPIVNFNNFQVEPAIRLFVSGVTLKAKPLDNDYSMMVSQYESFKKFSTNSKLINYFA